MAFIDSGKSFDKKANEELLKTQMSNMDLSSYLLRIPAHLHDKVRVKLVSDKKNLREVLLEYLEEYIK